MSSNAPVWPLVNAGFGGCVRSSDCGRPPCAKAAAATANALARRSTTITCAVTSPPTNRIASGVTDITEHPTAGEGKIYCCAIKDLFSNRIIGYAIDERMTAQLAVNALRAAVARRQPDGVVIVHADRGSQFRARSFRAVLTAAGLQGSMGRVASAGDNAAMESFWALLQKNVLDRHRWRTRDELHTRSSTGSNTPTTGAADNVDSAGSLRSNTS